MSRVTNQTESGGCADMMSQMTAMCGGAQAEAEEETAAEAAQETS